MSAAKKRLVKEADRVFSLHIRNRGANFGWNHCFTCGAYMLFEELQCGHFRSRRFQATRWHPFNCWPQCNDCNVTRNGNLKIYEKKLRSQYGDDAVDAIYELSTSGTGVTEEELKELIKKYR